MPPYPLLLRSQDIRTARAAAAAAAGPVPAIADRPARDFLDVLADRNPDLAEGISRIRKLDALLEEKTAKALELVRRQGAAAWLPGCLVAWRRRN